MIDPAAFRFFLAGVACCVLGVALFQVCILIALARLHRMIDGHGRVVRGRAMAAVEALGGVETGVAELVDEQRRRKATDAESVRFRRRMFETAWSRLQADARRSREGEPVEEGGDDGETGEEAGPAEVEDPEGQRGA